jgi:hypothetical protein
MQSTTDRLQKILRGAFSGFPTPLKDIPTLNGESRAVRKKNRPQKCARN